MTVMFETLNLLCNLMFTLEVKTCGEEPTQIDLQCEQKKHKIHKIQPWLVGTMMILCIISSRMAVCEARAAIRILGSSKATRAMKEVKLERVIGRV